MIDKILLGLAILISSNLIVSTLTLQTQAIVAWFNTTNTVLALVCILAGTLLWYSIRGIANAPTKDEDDDNW